ncbi:ArnT family glycosyltransferase [Rubinisphaera margarita]|uniref:ArnT family glycosyltransferase n=1 Tax=Rubinisphaera margarita TaxID=2909586 RepID=UPI001EE84CB5|nr:glycosyltransferase family 39 protein [Rubinisphaera margarita]MCG6157241.1 glycosyltransferase family 39 protein [Rubinisphaera margarita]
MTLPLKKHWQMIAFWALLLTHTGLLAYSAAVHSPNANEPAHLAAGVSHWEFGRFELYRVNPPLVRMVAAIPTVLLGYEEDWSSYNDYPGSRCVFYVGPDFMWANGYRSLWLTTYGRWACIPFCLVGICVCYRWSRELYGPMAGLLSMSLWAFSPSMIAHGSFFTPDAHAASMGLLAAYLFWKWLKEPDWFHAVLAGTGVGLALATKSTWIVLLGLWPALWLVWRLFRRQQENATEGHSRPPVIQLILLLLIGLNVLHLAYFYEGSFPRLGSFEFVSHSLKGNEEEGVGNRFRGTWLEHLPLPLPREFVAGIDVQKHDLDRPRQTYFRGRLHDHGFWYYYLYAIAIKVPIGTQLLWLAALIAFVTGCHGRNFCDEMILFIPVAIIMVLVSSQTNYNAHLRYVLGAFPFLFVLAGRLSQREGFSVHLRRWAVGGCLVWTVGSTLLCYPHCLSYFNETIGGSRNGYKHLANSNLDWGQDLLFLSWWLEEKGHSEKIELVYYGLFDPAIVGIDYENPAIVRSDVRLVDREQQRRLGFVSSNFRAGMEFFQWNGTGKATDFAGYDAEDVRLHSIRSIMSFDRQTDLKRASQKVAK